ncbi:hypothetical protein, variant 1 [Cladophialophora immunda]|uniref:Zn(2)-C6 fungal-type domain-containing protein n=1 Tax=Cladophialophora immunda TaxID=569365 RepID=A0A0D2AZD8_9EURO|nr:uncharacterized protein PV07_06399 [Cladophialophora immunda]XP_016250893.1 hypothetical protein, variant 1 [Cladophialophora immunda]KIW30676.1 hypothetical protein PV07_06399 [Cladophialophora immunda]KIW30677.1 hypothetical protein, variant 1 [Cladophialophora immunda]
MGNIGRPSTGCFLCRKRRVKCDEGRPGCRNCARLKKPCPGYREPGYGFIRTAIFVSNQGDSPTPRSSSSENLPQAALFRARSTSTEGDDSDSANSDSILHSTSRATQRLRLVNSPSGDLTENAVCYSLTQLDANSRVLYGNHAFNFLPEILSSSGRDSYLYAAMRSVAAINLANRSPTVDMHAIIESEYARAVSRVTAALADPEQCLKDETLVAVWLLGIRELLASVNGPHGGSAHQTHVDGTLMLLRLRGEEQFTRPAGRHLYHTLLSAMVWAPGKNLGMLSADLFQHWRPLFASEEPSPEYLMLESQIPKATSAVPTASLRLRSFFHGVTKLRARIRNFLLMPQHASVDRFQTMDSYLRAAARLEDKISGWCDILDWLPRKVLVDTPHRYLPRTPWTSGTLFRLHCFESWEAFFHWNRYFVAKICLHAALLDAIASLGRNHPRYGNGDSTDGTDELVITHTAVIHEIVKDFLGTLAYAFGDVDKNGRLRNTPTAVVGDGASTEQRGIDIPSTLQVQAPLSHLITLKYLGPGQREAMFLALQRIRAEFSVR